MVLISMLLFHLSLLINTQFTLWPEMVVYPYLINNGFLLYKDIVNPYPPFLSYFLSWFSNIFGYEPLSFQALTWITIILIDVIIFYITKKLFKRSRYAYIAVIFFTLISTAFGINGLWFDLVQTPLIISSVYLFYLFLKTKNSSNLNFSLILLTLAFFIKQQTIWLALLFAVIISRKYKQKSFQVILKSYKSFFPFLLVAIFQVVFYWQNNSFQDFLYWTFYFPLVKASSAAGYISLPTARQMLTIAALYTIFIPTFLKSKLPQKFLIGVSVVLLAFSFPRFDYFHLIPAISILAIIFGKNIDNLLKVKTFLKFIAVASLLLITVFSARSILRNWQKEVRFFEQEVYQSAKTIDLLSAEDEKIYVQNGPDQVLAITGRLPPKPWVDEFPWYLEDTNLQNRVVQGIENESVRLILFKPYNVGPAFGLGSYQPEKIVEFIDKNYSNLSQISDTFWIKSKR